MRSGDVEATYPLSPTQEGLLFHGLSPIAGIQLDQQVVELREPIDHAALIAAFERVVERHDALRTRFVWEDVERPMQEVLREVLLPSVRIDLRGTPEEERELGLREFLARDRGEGLTLSEAPLMRIALLDFAHDHHALVWTHHHSILDGGSVINALGEVFDVYDAMLEGREPVLAPPVQLRTYIESLGARDVEGARAFFADMLRGVELPTPVPFGAVAVEGSGHGEVESRLDREATKALANAAAEAGVTVNTMLQAGVSVLLSRYSGEPTVVFGATRAGRHSVERAHEIVGLMISTVPVRADVGDELRVRDVLEALRREWVAIRPHEHTPLVEIRDAVSVRAPRPLFEALFVFDMGDIEDVLKARSAHWGKRSYRHFAHTDTPFTFALAGGDELVLRLEHDLSRLDEAGARRVLAHLETVLRALPHSLDATIGDLPVLPEDERRLVIEGFNDTAREVAETTLHEIVADSAHRTPDAIAMVADGEALSYGALLRRARGRARALADAGVGPGSRVCTLLPRGLAQAEAWLGIVASGAAFVPVDPDHPAGHLAHVLADSNAELVLTLEEHRARVPEGLRVICLDDASHETKEAGEDAFDVRVSPDDDAYVIYTSGSTGLPKGVAVSHRAIVNHALAIRDAYALGPRDRVVQFASPAFDVALEELFPTWAASATVVTRPAQLLSSVAFAEWMDDVRATVLNLPTAFFHEWTHALSALGTPIGKRVRLVAIGGERVSPKAVERFRALAPRGARLVNAYGPTEATVTATLYDATERGERSVDDEIPIGRPIANARAYVLDRRGRPTPIGIPGELHLGGVGVARGYLSSPELTKQKFVPDPFSPGPGARMYRTGDRARWLASGDLEFLGRVDAQIKLRGYRIEPGAVERALMEHPFVRDAAVLLVEGDGAGARLVAWVARAPGQSVDDHELRTLLRERLPEPMIPGAIVLMDELPRNTSDKIDRARLPPPPREVDAAASSDGAPASPIEELLVGIWATALGRDHVSVHDDFFDLGGHSILALKIIDLAARAGLTITTEQLLHHANVRDLAAAATMNIAERSEGSLVVLRREGTRPPLFLVHSTPGDLLGYVNLVHALGHDQPVYGLQSLGLVRPDAAHTTLEAMARHYLADVRRVSPHGPYFLGGWCYGGFVSVEMARLLCAEGEEVALVALLEAEAPRPRLVSHPRYYSARARAVLSMGPKGVIDLLKDRARHLWRDRNRTLRDHLVYEVNEGLLANRDTVVEQNMCAIYAYQPTYYDGHLTLFRATEVDGVAIPDPSMGWSALARSFEVHDVEGRHETILHRPQVNELARLLRAAMDRAGTRESARPRPTAA